MLKVPAQRTVEIEPATGSRGGELSLASPQAVRMDQLAAAADDSGQSSRLAAMATLANDGPAQRLQRKTQDSIGASPRQAQGQAIVQRVLGLAPGQLVSGDYNNEEAIEGEITEVLGDRYRVRITSIHGEAATAESLDDIGVMNGDLALFNHQWVRPRAGGDGAMADLAPAAPPNSYSCNAIGKGVANVAEETRLYTSGLNTCVGWLLYNNFAAYLTHIVVLDPAHIVADGSLAAQVATRVAEFTAGAGAAPTHVHIRVDSGQPAYAGERYAALQAGWMAELLPAGCAHQWSSAEGVFEHRVPAHEGARGEWNGAAMTVTEPAAAAQPVAELPVVAV